LGRSLHDELTSKLHRNVCTSLCNSSTLPNGHSNFPARNPQIQ
jgi:hypothetical protein